MVTSKGKKTIGFAVPEQYPFTGKQYRDSVDKLFEAIWSELSAEKQKKIMAQFGKEIEALNWRCE